jgi:hypothetical protein
MLSPGTKELYSNGHSAPPAERSEKENRRIQRISLPLPARIEVMVDQKVTWNEITRLVDVSAFGSGFELKRPVRRGRLVLVTLPMPRQLRSYDYSEPQYKIWALVRRCVPMTRRHGVEYAVGVAFTGRSAPPGYLDHPSMLYDISHRDEDGNGFWHLVPADVTADEAGLSKDMRKQTRFPIPEPIILERVDEAMNLIASESTVTENISLGGAAIFTTHDIPKGSFLRVRSDRFDVTILGVVRCARVGTDGIKRLHVEFIDRFFPLEGIV